MAADVEIVDIAASRPRTIMVPEMSATAVEHTAQVWIDIAVTVANRSRQVTYYCIADLRYLSFDPATGTVLTGFHQPPAHPALRVSHLRPPATRAVLPGGDVVLRASLPQVIHRVRLGDTTMGTDTFDLSAADRLVCRVGYDRAPFRVRPGEDAAATLRRLRTWNRTPAFTAAMRHVDRTHDANNE
jgi:hypothetical protein